MRNIVLLVATLLVTSIGYNSKDNSALEKPGFLGTTWAMHLKGDAYDYFWLSCDSTYTYYSCEALIHYYGRFRIKDDTLILDQQYKDDYDNFGVFPIKVKSLDVDKLLIENDSTLLYVSSSYDENISPPHKFRLKQRFNCNSLNNH